MIVLLTKLSLIGALCFVCASDLYKRKIHNVNVLIIMFCVVLLCVENEQLMYDTFIIVTVSSFLLYSFGIIGGGDVKLLCVLSPLIPIAELPVYAFNIAFVGGVLALYYLFVMAACKVRKTLPYGVAISVPFMLTICEMGSL